MGGWGRALALALGGAPLRKCRYIARLTPRASSLCCAGSVVLNRMHRAVDRLSFEEKRNLIYGGDMIVP